MAENMGSQSLSVFTAESVTDDPEVGTQSASHEQKDANHSYQCDEEELILEKEHFKKIVNAFLYYKSYARSRLQKLWISFTKLPKSHCLLLPDFPSHMKECFKAAEENSKFLNSVVANAVGVFQNSDVSEFDPHSASSLVHEASGFDMTKVGTTLRQFFRDWSKEGETERQMCYGLIIKEILERFQIPECDRSSIKVLVPGSGLGRLAYDIAHLGYCCQGNEFSMYMLLASNFILNKCSEVGGYTIYPWVLQTCNNYSNKDQLSPVRIPDVNPSDLPVLGLFSMAAGDFLDVYSLSSIYRTMSVSCRVCSDLSYSIPDYWDCVACSFFIDTAHNIILYIEKICAILKEGGLWINFGPLLYHFADIPNEVSLELSWEDVRQVIIKTGFEILKEEHKCPSPYIQNPGSMLQLNYECVFLVARKQVKPNSLEQLAK